MCYLVDELLMGGRLGFKKFYLNVPESSVGFFYPFFP